MTLFPPFLTVILAMASPERGCERLPPARMATPWARAPLLCVDGRRSPTCTCGRESYRGCCSGHGGVAGCSLASSTSVR